MPNLSQIRNFNLKVIFLIHFVFISLSAMGHWSTSGYLFYNSILIFFLIWSIYQDQNHEPLQLAIVVNGCSIILDMLLLVMGFPDHGARAIEKFSAAFTILHLIVRPFTTIVLVKNLEERSGSTDLLSGIITSPRNDTYEDIDRPTTAPPYPPGIKTGYDFSTAQQI